MPGRKCVVGHEIHLPEGRRKLVYLFTEVHQARGCTREVFDQPHEFPLLSNRRQQTRRTQIGSTSLRAVANSFTCSPRCIRRAGALGRYSTSPTSSPSSAIEGNRLGGLPAQVRPHSCITLSSCSRSTHRPHTMKYARSAAYSYLLLPIANSRSANLFLPLKLLQVSASCLLARGSGSCSRSCSAPTTA